MKTIPNSIKYFILMAGLVLVFLPGQLNAQDVKNQALDQNISIYAEEEPLSSVIEKICKYLDIDYKYNSNDLKEKKISLNISNKPIKYVLDKLMKDFYLLFEIEDNLLVVRDYVPLDESIGLDRNAQQYFASNRGFMFDNPRAKKITIKFKSSSNLIIIPVNINDSDTLNFILDTGVRFPIITELPFVNKLNLNYMMPVTVKGLDDGEGLTAYRSGNNVLHIDGLSAQNQEVQMIIDEDFQISHMLGIPVHGLIGFNLFKDFVVEINYSDEELTLYRPEYYKYRDHKNDIIMPLHFDGYKPFVRTTIVTDSMKTVPVKLLVDTGASDALWLSEKSDERIHIPEKHVETFLGRGLSGDLYGTKGRIDAIWVGPLLLTQPIVAFPDSDLMERLIATNDRNGTIGAEILRRFYVTVDYRNSRLTLRPNSRIKDDFNYNMSGMEVINPVPGLPVYTIADITKDSPAYFAGLQKDDQILTINSNSHRSIELNDINLLLQSKENKKIRVTVLRNGEEIKTSFELKKMF